MILMSITITKAPIDIYNPLELDKSAIMKVVLRKSKKNKKKMDISKVLNQVLIIIITLLRKKLWDSLELRLSLGKKWLRF
jgi:hypothetical protein